MFDIDGNKGAAIPANALIIHTVADDCSFQSFSGFMTLFLLSISVLSLQVTFTEPECEEPFVCWTASTHSYMHDTYIHLFQPGIYHAPNIIIGLGNPAVSKAEVLVLIELTF